VEKVANLIVRNIDSDVVKALKERAGKSGNSAEAEHRKILAHVLLNPQKKSLAEIINKIPNLGNDADFDRQNETKESDVFS